MPHPGSHQPFDDQGGMDAWKAFHALSLTKMEGLEAAMAAGDGLSVQAMLGWLATDLIDHHLAEEKVFFPLLRDLNADALGGQMAGDHREMWDLTRQLFAEEDTEMCALTARRLIELIRQHISTEEHVLLPLLKIKPLYLDRDAAPGEGAVTLANGRVRLGA